MVRSIHIQNIALIENLKINFDAGLNIISGETGAGKSVLLNAIGLILGEKLNSSSLRTGSNKGSVEVVFDISNNVKLKELLKDSGIEIDEDDQLIIRREITDDSKSRSFVNLNSVPNTSLKGFGEYLLDISGQHSHQSLLRPQTHIDLLDNFANLNQQREEFSQLFHQYQNLKSNYEQLKSAEEERQKANEMNLFAIDEIEKANLQLDEDSELERELEALNNYEKLNSSLERSYNFLYQNEESIISNTEKVVIDLEGISGHDEELDKAHSDIKEALYLIENAKDVIRSYKVKLEYSPERLEEINERLELIKTLKKKYGSTIQEIFSYKEKSESEVENYSKDQEQLNNFEKEISKLKDGISETAINLSKARQKNAKRLEEQIQRELTFLGMEKATIKVEFRYIQDDNSFLIISDKGVKIEEKGIDRLEFIFSANPGEIPRPLIKIASGGELSRVMLAIKTILTEMDEIDTLLFDEVDAGIGGETSIKVGKKIKEISQKRQILCITHSPQIASLSDHHYLVEKQEEDGRTRTYIRSLDKDEKVKEIARMLSGETTELSLQHARELIEKE